jgi:3-oxoacyl-[acyl-carrier protein] reductase
VHIDIAGGESIVAAKKAVMDKYGRADIFVNSAGFTRPILLSDLNALDNDFLIDY